MIPSAPSAPSARSVSRQPVLFVSHGAPDMVLRSGATRDFLSGLAGLLPAPPRAVLVISAHWRASVATVATATAPATIHDFYGFPEALYRLRYKAPGAPALAARARDLLLGAGLAVAEDAGRGLDHGAWTPLMLAWPAADLPVAALSLVPGDAAAHLTIGRALAPLSDDGVLILASGSLTHDLRGFFAQRGTGGAEAGYVTAFAGWVDGVLADGDEGAGSDLTALADWWRLAPHAACNHPTDEHLMPLMVAAGAGAGRVPRRLHSAVEGRVLRLDAWGWF
jgi:4,5-DOPA dioxygenase extradiol